MTGSRSWPRVVARITARLEEIDLVDRLASVWFGFTGLRGDQRDRLLLGVREAVANAVTHGSGLDPEKSVEIVFQRRNNLALVRVVDQGEGFDPEALPDPLAPENLLRPTGRGILLMRAYFDEVDFEFSGGTRVELSKVLPEPVPDEEE